MTDAEAQALAAWLDSVRDDPVAFVEGAFEWGKGELENSRGPEPWQKWVLIQIRDGLLKPGEAIKIAISSGHGVGKKLSLCMDCTLGYFDVSGRARYYYGLI